MRLISSSCYSREAYSKIAPYEADIRWSPLHQRVWTVLSDYYERDPDAKDIDVEVLKGLLKARYPKNADDWDLYQFNKTSEPNVVQLVRDTVRASKMQSLGIAVNDGDYRKAEEIILDLAQSPEGEVDDGIVNDPGFEFLETMRDTSNLIPVAPRQLNDLLGGGVPPGTQIGIFARPDTGKTVVAINQAKTACMVGKRVLFLSNEDPEQTLFMRFVTSFTKLTKEQIMQDTKAAYKLAMERGYGNLYFKALAPGNIKEVYRLVEQVKPDMVVIDQVRNLSIYGSDGNLTDILTRAPIKLRDIAKKYNLVMVLVTQAGESAHNKLVLDITDVEYSNTGFAAQLDLMIGVGQNADYHRDGYVSWSFPKNKFTGPIDPQMYRIDYARNLIGGV